MQLYVPPEARYAMPAADQILINRQYTVSYSYRIRQPKWVLEVIDAESEIVNVDRTDSFRSDYRIPEQFRVDDDHYQGSGYERGHLIVSANRLNSSLLNSETFLISNMSPQSRELNNGLWKELEMEVRNLKQQDNIEEVYSICGPLWAYGKAVESIETALPNVIIPIPHMFFKCILSVNGNGRFKQYAFIIPHGENLSELKDYQYKVKEVEQFAGLFFWQQLSGSYIDRQKNTKYSLCF